MCELGLPVLLSRCWTFRSLDVVLSEDVNQNNIVAQYRLPFSFRVVAKLPQGQKRTRRQMEEPEAPLVVDQRNVRARFDNFSQRDADDERNDHPMPAFSPRNTPQGGQYREGDSSNAFLPPQPPQNAGPNPSPLCPCKTPNPAIAPPRTDGEPAPTLTEVNPKHGSIMGGVVIWLTGFDFPASFPLFARFGTTVVPAVSIRDERCKPQLNKFLRPFLVASFLPVICPPQTCRVSSMLRYRSTPSQMRRSMELASRSFNI